jgi:hypothetical protein
MDSLRLLVLRLICADRAGGRVEVMDNRTLVLYDCTAWDSHCTDSVVARYPEARISVHSSRQSLSGFAVTVHMGRNPGRETGWVVVIGLFMAGCAYILLRPPWWSNQLLHI